MAAFLDIARQVLSRTEKSNLKNTTICDTDRTWYIQRRPKIFNAISVKYRTVYTELLDFYCYMKEFCLQI